MSERPPAQEILETPPVRRVGAHVGGRSEVSVRAKMGGGRVGSNYVRLARAARNYFFFRTSEPGMSCRVRMRLSPLNSALPFTTSPDSSVPSSSTSFPFELLTT